MDLAKYRRSEREQLLNGLKTRDKVVTIGGLHGTVLEVETENRAYTIRYEGCGRAFISGHPVFCPEPTLVTIHGSTSANHQIGMPDQIEPIDCVFRNDNAPGSKKRRPSRSGNSRLPCVAR